MNTNATPAPFHSAELDDFVEVDDFSTSMSPINCTEKSCFKLRDRLCCIGVFAIFIAIMRFVLSS